MGETKARYPDMTRFARIFNTVALIASLVTLFGAFALALAGCMEPPLVWKHGTYDSNVHLSSGIDLVSESLDPVREAAEASLRQNRQR